MPGESITPRKRPDSTKAYRVVGKKKRGAVGRERKKRRGGVVLNVEKLLTGVKENHRESRSKGSRP
jgi:hypothetical protein